MSQVPNLSQLFQTAHEEGDLSMRSLAVLNIPDVGAQIQQGLGMPVGDIQTSELVLVSVQPDDSGSIRFVTGNAQAVRDGHNAVIDALLASKQRNSVLFSTRYLNGFVLNEWRLLEHAVRMDSGNYDPNLGTPLYDNAVVLLGSVIAKTQEAKQNGQVARTVTLIVTDGHDEHSVRSRPADVASLVRDMLLQETHIVAAMGVDDGSTNFRSVFQEMGIRDEWILTPGNTPSEIRKAFAVFSTSAVRASQNAANFSQTAVGGFGNP